MAGGVEAAIQRRVGAHFTRPRDCVRLVRVQENVISSLTVVIRDYILQKTEGLLLAALDLSVDQDIAKRERSCASSVNG